MAKQLIDYYSLIIAVIFISTVIANSSSLNTTGVYGEWRQVHSRLYSSGAETLKPNETIRLLKRLKDINYNPFDAHQAQVLIELSETGEEKCVKNKLSRLDSWIEYYQHDDRMKKNIVPYLQHQRRDQFLRCKVNFSRNLKRAVASLPKGDKTDMELLIQCIVKVGANKTTGPPSLPVPEKHLLEGLLHFIDIKSGPLRKFVATTKGYNTARGKDTYSLDFYQVVGVLCSTIKSNFEQELFVFDAVGSVKDVGVNMDHLTEKWITNAKVCHQIDSNMAQLIEKSYAVMMSWTGQLHKTFGKPAKID